MPGILKSSTSSLGKRKRPSIDQSSTKFKPAQPAATTVELEQDASEHDSSILDEGLSEEEASSSSDEEQDEERARELFRRAFEKRFAPLPGGPRKQGATSQIRKGDKGTRDDDEALEDEDLEWSGFTSDASSVEDDDGTEPPSVQIVNYASAQHDDEDEARDAFTERELKRAFMSSRPPSAARTSHNPSKQNDDDEDPATAHEHLKKDLELSRLIAESRLLSRDPYTTAAAPKADQNTRRKMTEARLASLGAKDTAFKQRNVPASIRNGMKNKEREREGKRRKEAAENGIVLEKKTRRRAGGEGGARKQREKSVGNPGVGKFKGGTLSLSKKDLGRLTTPKVQVGKNGKPMKKRRF